MTVAGLGVSSRDRMVISVTLSHAFGVGMGAAAAFGQGASVVLPGGAVLW